MELFRDDRVFYITRFPLVTESRYTWYEPNKPGKRKRAKRTTTQKRRAKMAKASKRKNRKG